MPNVKIRLHSSGYLYYSGGSGAFGIPIAQATDTLTLVADGYEDKTIGVDATDFVFLVMDNRGADSLIHSKVKLGADATAAAGPKGREAEADTDVTMRAEILTYSRARGVFAGVSLEGSTLRPDNDGNKHLYGEKVDAETIITERSVHAPEAAAGLISTRERRPRNTGAKLVRSSRQVQALCFAVATCFLKKS